MEEDWENSVKQEDDNMPVSKKRLLYMEERVLYTVMVTNPSELDS